MRRFVLLATALCTFAALVVPGSSASLADSQCGDVITSDAVLTHDLFCSGDGLTIPGFVDVTLDLHGHSIVGSGVGSGIRVMDGLVVDPSRSAPANVTVENGSVQGFGTGINIGNERPGSTGIADLHLAQLFIHDNDEGVVEALDKTATVLINSRVSENHLDGVQVAGLNNPGRFRVIADHVTNNGGDGIRAKDDSLGLLQDSFIAHNGGVGARLIDTVAVITGNTFRGNADTGLSINEQVCSFFPFYLISDNVADQNGNGGMEMQAFCPSPPPPPPGSGNAAKNNAGFQCVVIVCAKNRGQR